MSLRFENVSLKNFGPYRDIESLNLETEPDSPIVVIHGENTLGKTRLFRALRWCLYGSPDATKSPKQAARDLEHYLNRPAARDGENKMQVRMRFTANGYKYDLARTATFDGRSPRVEADLRVDSTVIQQAAIDAEIGRLLHPQISDFFLFDGELLRHFYDRLNTERERELLRESIDNVLGIPALQLAERDVSMLHDDALDRRTKSIKKQKDKDNARKQLRELTSKQESLNKDRKEVEESLLKARTDLEDVQSRIAGIEELKADARELEGLESQIAGGKQEDAELRDEMRALLTDGWLAPAAAKLNEALRGVVDRNNAAQAQGQAIQVAQSRVEMLEQQVRGGNCPTCLQELPQASESTLQALTDARAESERLKNETSTGADMQLERRIRALIDSTTAARYQEKQKRLNKLVTSQFDRNRRLGALKDRLKNHDAAAIRALGEEQDRLEQVIDQYEQSLRGFKPKQDELKKSQDKFAAIVGRMGGAQPALAAEEFFFKYVDTLLDRTIGRYQERTRGEVEQVASEMFVTLVRDASAYRGLRISSDYRIEIVGERNEGMETSEGGKQLVALSLIGALKQAAVRGGPVVLDSPLARLDLEHRANVLQKWVPGLGTQAVLLVQSGELTEKQAREIMGNRIGQEYRIYRPNDDPDEATIERTQ